jgi:hypothetical protein
MVGRRNEQIRITFVPGTGNQRRHHPRSLYQHSREALDPTALPPEAKEGRQRMMSSILLSVLIAAPTSYGKRPLTHRQARSQAHQIVQMLKRQDPRVLRSVMYYMKWAPRLEFKKESACKKKNNNKDVLKQINDWEMDMLLDMSGIPRKKR